VATILLMPQPAIITQLITILAKDIGCG
jgi:hypothetical protein